MYYRYRLGCFGVGTLKAKYLPYKLVNNYTVPVLIIGLVIAAGAARSSSDEARAQKLGFKDGRDFLLPVKITLPMLPITQSIWQSRNLKLGKAAQDAVLAAEKEQKAKEQRLNACVVTILNAIYRNMNEEIMYVKKLSRILLSTNLSGLMELQNQNFPL
jgi:hypothetical protein